MRFLAVIVAILLAPGRLVWPYVAGAVILAIGLTRIIRSEGQQARGIDKAVALGPLFLALPMAVFGADHFVFSKTVAAIVPSWIPGHMFWTYFVGIALIASALSIVTRQHSALAAFLLSAMLCSFVLLIHLPSLAAHGDRISLAVLLRDLSFSGGTLACAAVQGAEWSRRSLNKITTIARFFLAVPAVVFGVEHFLYPHLVPIVPLRQLMPSWIPGHLLLAWVIGTALIVSGLCILVNWKARLAAAWMGILVLVTVFLVYLPILIANISDIAKGLNYFADTLAFGGSALLVANVLSLKDRPESPAANHGERTEPISIQRGNQI